MKNNKKDSNNKGQGDHVKNVIFLLLPIVLIMVCILCTFKLAYNKIIEINPLIKIVSRKDYDYDEDDTIKITDFVYTEPVTEELETEAETEKLTEKITEINTSEQSTKPQETAPNNTPSNPITSGSKIIDSADSTSPTDITYTSDEFPIIYYESCWAVLNVDGWKKRNINIYFGDSDELLGKGGGLWFGSSFCGQNSKVVISGHVMSYFYSLEDTKPGTKVTMTTSYGTYIYEVSEKIVFHETNTDILYDNNEGDILFLYTCYPRSVGLNRTETRCALKCKLISGCEYEEYIEE